MCILPLDPREYKILLSMMSYQLMEQDVKGQSFTLISIFNERSALQDKKNTHFVQAEAVHIEREGLITGV